MPDPLPNLLTSFLAEVDRLGQRALASGDYDRWARDFQQALVDYHLGAYFLGKDATQLSPEAEKVLDTLISQQLAYAKKFGEQASALSDAAFLARSSLYGGALKATYYRAKYGEWDLPFVPTEKCECIVNCTCMIRVDDKGGGKGNMIWILGDNEHCPTCIQRYEDNPHVVYRVGASKGISYRNVG